MCNGVRGARMACMFMTGSGPLDAERAFTRQLRSRRRAALTRWLRRDPAPQDRLRVYDEPDLRARITPPGCGIREIPLDAIGGTLEPTRATLFDHCFRPRPGGRGGSGSGCARR